MTMMENETLNFVKIVNFVKIDNFYFDTFKPNLN